MSSEYKGFRIWNLEFQALDPSGQNVTTDSNGRMLDTSTGAIYWSETDQGLSSHLLDFLSPMCNQSDNGVGWELDADVYNKLYNIVQNNDPAYSSFITRNSNIWDANNNPTGDKTIKLVPTEYVRVMCFKHILGYRVMIGLSLYAMAADNRVTSYTYNSSYSKKIDPGFLGTYIYSSEKNSGSSSNGYPSIGGLFISMIPPENNSTIPSGIWNLEYPVYDSAFFVPTMTPIIPMIHSLYYSGNTHTNYYACSWLKLGTSTAYNAGNNAGVIAGTNMKLSLMLDSKANVALSYKYVSNSNTTSLNPIILVGPVYSKKIFADDTLCTNLIGCMCYNICGNKLQDGSYSTSASYYNAAWLAYYSSSYYSYYTGAGASDSFSVDSAYTYVGSFDKDATDFNRYRVYTAYPACPSTVYLNFRYAKAAYTEIGLLDEEIFRWVQSTGLVKGQTYNDGQWIYTGVAKALLAQDGTTSSKYLYPSLRWDGEFNGTKTFA